MLSLSVQDQGEDIDIGGVVKGSDEVDARLPGGRALARFAEAVVEGSDGDIAAVQEAVIEAVGPDGFVDAAGVIGNFERMVRIADGTGIPLDEMGVGMSAGVREELGLDSMPSAAHTFGDKPN